MVVEFIKDLSAYLSFPPHSHTGTYFFTSGVADGVKLGVGLGLGSTRFALHVAQLSNGAATLSLTS